MAGVIVRGISKTFGGGGASPFRALQGIDLEVRSGESFALLGPSGCGKTTLLRIISGLERPDSGTITMDGRDVTALAPDKRPSAMVFQSYALFPHLTVEGNVAFGLKIRRDPREEIARKVGEALRLVQLEGLGRRKVGELSGGQQQRVALARVLAIEPKILLMDEPLSNLDAELRRSTRSAIRKIQTELGLTMIYVTHDQEEGLMISDRLALMREGKILQMGTPEELFDRPASVEVARFLGQRNMVEAVIRGFGEDCIQVALGDREAGPLVWIGADAGGESWEIGRRVWLALKPDEVELCAARGGEGVGWPGKIELRSFAGSKAELEIRLEESGQAIRAEIVLEPGADESEEARFSRGDRVLVRARNKLGLLYSRGDSRHLAR